MVPYLEITFVINSRRLSNLSDASASLDSRHIFKYPDRSSSVCAASAGAIAAQSKSNAAKNSSAAKRCFADRLALISPDIKSGPASRSFSIAAAPNPRRGRPIMRELAPQTFQSPPHRAAPHPRQRVPRPNRMEQLKHIQARPYVRRTRCANPCPVARDYVV